MDQSPLRAGHRDCLGSSIRRAHLSTLALLLIVTPAITQAEVITSITPTTGTGNLGTTVTQAGNLYDITGGTRLGDGPNLFHSFGDFTVGAGDISNFLNDTGLQTSNIFGRVTSGNISNLYGTVQTTGFGNANLFLMNPSGIIFGPNGSVNVGGSVSFSTAQYLRLFDSFSGMSANFYTNPANDGLANSVLAVAPVADFGFLSLSPAAYGFLASPDPSAAIVLQGNTLSVALSAEPGSAISLIGGNVVIQGASLPDGRVQSALLSAPNRTIQVATSASPGEFDMASLQTLPNVDGAMFTSSASVTLAPGSSLDVRGGSSVFIIGGQLVYSINDATLKTTDPDLPAPADTILLSPGSAIVTQTSGTDSGADMGITVGTLQIDGTTVQTIQSGDGPGGNIDIHAATVGLTNGSLIETLTSGAGRGGHVQLSADTLAMDNFSSIFTATLDGNGIGGDVNLNVGIASLMNGSLVLSHGFQRVENEIIGVGSAGNMSIQGRQGVGSAAESVTLSGGSSLSTQSFGSSDGGRVDLTARWLTMDGLGTTINASANDVGRGGDIIVNVQEANLSNGATITTQANSVDPLGPAGPTVTVQGLPAAGSMADFVVFSGLGSGIIADSSGTTPAGEVAVQAKTVSLTDGAVIQAGSPFTTAAGSNVSIEANSVDIFSGSRITSQANGLDAGQVTITANQLTMDHGSIETNTSGPGRGGEVVLIVGNANLTNGARVDASSSGTGNAANIAINASTVTLNNGSQISSASTGTEPLINFGDGTTEPLGRAGNVTITATGGFTSNASSITTSAEANHGGDISITADSVQLSNGTGITANSKAPLEVTKLVLDQNGQLVPQVVGDGDAGSITIHSGSTVVMHNSVMTAEASQASGGQFTMTTPEMLWMTNSRISTSVFGGNFSASGGNITIDPQFVILLNSQIIANAFFGLGGAINITAGVFLADLTSIVEASSTLSISSPVQNIGGQLTPLSQDLSSAAAPLLTQRCAADSTGQFSSFVQTGRDSVPQVPGALSPSPLSFLETLTSGSFGSPATNWAATRLGLGSVRFDDSTRFRSACRS